MPLDKQFAYIEDMLKRKEYDKAQVELERILSQKELKKEDRIKALIMREKTLFLQKFYTRVESDYYRLKALYPKEKEIDQFKEYLEAETGIATLHDEVIKNPNDPALQHKLLSQYKFFGWMNFAEEFFAETIKDTSQPTIKSLSEIYFLKQDFDMLIKLSQKAQELYPQETDFKYNEGVGYYSKGDSLSRKKATEVFQELKRNWVPPHLRKNVNWYLNRLSPQSQF